MAKFLGGNRVAARIVCVLVWLTVLGMCWLRIDAADAGSGTNGVQGESRLEFLRTEIARHDELYFRKAAPEISDEAYDRLKRELEALERSAALRAERVGRRETLGTAAAVGDDRSGRFPTARHGERMMSLAKVYSEAELRVFLRRVEMEARGADGVRGADSHDVSWVVEPKYDGLAISATYERGRLVRVVTRGNGLEGDEVTANARVIEGLPAVLAGTEWPERIEVRGEVYVTFAEFGRVNAKRAASGESLFANPRALAAGSLKLNDAAEVSARGLSMVFYGWGEVLPSSARAGTQSGFQEKLKTWRLPGVAEVKRAETVEDVCAAVREFSRRRAELAFPTDGVVIKLDSVSHQERLGTTDHAPRWAVAYKFSTERVATRVTEITIQVGRSGVLTPVAELEPVRLGGSLVARATLHNAEEIARLDVRPGDVVFVEKAGEIIPAVVGVDRTGQTGAGNLDAVKPRAEIFEFPADCPACGAAVVTRTDESVRQYCPNRECPAQILARLRHFTGAQGVSIRGLGEETLAKLVERGKVRAPADIYRLTQEDWRALPGMGEKSAEKLAAAVEASKRAELWRFVHALGISGVGVTTSRILAVRFGSLEALANATAPELARIDGVGVTQAGAIAAFFAEAQNRTSLAELRGCGVEPRRPELASDKRGSSRLKGKVFVITGSLRTLTRAEAEERIVAAGGVVGAHVTEKTDFLVAGQDAGEKRRRADELLVSVIDEETLTLLLVESAAEQDSS